MDEWLRNRFWVIGLKQGKREKRPEETNHVLAQSGQAFAMRRSLRTRGDGFTSEFQRPKSSNTITVAGATFNWSATSFDAYSRPTSVTKSSSLGFSRTEFMGYYDDVANGSSARCKA